MLEEPNDEDDLCGYLCFFVGMVLMFLVVGVIALVIVLGVDDGQVITSLTSTRPVKPLTPGVLESLQDTSTMYSQVIDDTVTSSSSSSSTSSLDLLILIRSLPANSSSRDAIRESWMRDVPSPSPEQKVEVLFAVPAASISLTQLKTLKQESQTHRDMVIFLDAPYVPESEALMLELVWAMRARKFSYLMKTRDTMYIRLDLLVSTIVQGLIETSSNAYLGYFEGKQSPWDKKRSGTKLKEPGWYLCDRFIRFAHSGGYILSRKLVDRLHSHASMYYPYNNEDISVGVWLSPYNDVDWTHVVQFNTEIGRSRGCRNNYIVFPPSDGDMRSQHNRFQDGKPTCFLEHEAAESYSYNFNIAPSKCCTPIKFEGV